MSDIASMIKEEYLKLVKERLSLQLATVSPDGMPSASYAPYVFDDNLNFFVFLSDLSSHTTNLSATPKASAMIIEDEAQSEHLFARKRLSVECSVTRFERRTPESEYWLKIYRQRFGEFVDLLVQLQDFNLHQLKPTAGVYVKGFGQAYRISGKNMDEIEHIIPANRS